MSSVLTVATNTAFIRSAAAQFGKATAMFAGNRSLLLRRVITRISLQAFGNSAVGGL
jgi:hypothetical protein